MHIQFSAPFEFSKEDIDAGTCVIDISDITDSVDQADSSLEFQFDVKKIDVQTVLTFSVTRPVSKKQDVTLLFKVEKQPKAHVHTAVIHPSKFAYNQLKYYCNFEFDMHCHLHFERQEPKFNMKFYFSYFSVNNFMLLLGSSKTYLTFKYYCLFKLWKTTTQLESPQVI